MLTAVPENLPKDDNEPGFPIFSILGSVDGIREELAPSLACHSGDVSSDFEDDDSWVVRKVIVECKHRMSRIYKSPPLFEQIQAVTYCLMFQVGEADIVQVLRTCPIERHEASRLTKRANDAGTDKTEELHAEGDGREQSLSMPAAEPYQQGASTDATAVPCNESSQDDKNRHRTAKLNSCPQSSYASISINRVSLNDPIMCHREHWAHCILPRLRSFCDAVYRVRSSDEKRYRMLMAVSEASLPNNTDSEADFAIDCQASPWQILFNECPWLQCCDIAYRNDA
jgi:hypothetical protein